MLRGAVEENAAGGKRWFNPTFRQEAIPSPTRNGVNIRFDQRAVRGQLALEERDDDDSTCHGVAHDGFSCVTVVV